MSSKWWIEKSASWRILKYMEKFRIAQYGLIQVAAIVYGILSCGAIAKAGKLIAEIGRPMPEIYYFAMYIRGLYYLGFLVVMVWVAYCSFKSSSWARQTIDERQIIISRLALSGFFFVVSTWLLLTVLVVTFAPISPLK